MVKAAVQSSYEYFAEDNRKGFNFGLVKLAGAAAATPVPIDSRNGRDLVAGYGMYVPSLSVVGSYVNNLMLTFYLQHETLNEEVTFHTCVLLD